MGRDEIDPAGVRMTAEEISLLMAASVQLTQQNKCANLMCKEGEMVTMGMPTLVPS